MTRWIDAAEAEAAERLDPVLYAYFRQGAGDETALGEARPAWDALRLRPRVLRDMSAVTTATTVLGTPVSTPILVAPSALQHRADPGGEVATAQGVAKAGSLICVSSSAGVPYTEIRDTGAPWWAQLYILGDRGITRELLARAREAGARAVVLTGDTPVLGARAVKEPQLVQALGRERVTYYGGVPVPPEVLRQAPDLTFRDIAWVAAESGLPVLIKGVLRGDDTRTAVGAGASGVVVSNHGGRQLNSALATADALPDVVEALAGTGAETYVDGGIRTGEHALAALALGARAVLVGRPALWALATRGADGVRALLSDLTEEFALALTLAGARGPQDVSPDLVARPPRPSARGEVSPAVRPPVHTRAMRLSHDVSPAGSRDGDEGGPAVLLLHAWGADRRMWEPQWRALTDAGMTVVRCDFRGHGGTPAADSTDDAQDVLDLLDLLGVETTAIVGASFGARVAQDVAARAPKRVTALALLSPGEFGKQPTADLLAFVREEHERLAVGDVNGAADLNTGTFLGPEADPVTRDELHRQIRETYGGWLASGTPSASRRIAAEVSTIDIPTLIVTGGRDLDYFRETDRDRQVPGARHVVLPRAGHLPSLEMPQEINELLLGFLTAPR